MDRRDCTWERAPSSVAAAARKEAGILRRIVDALGGTRAFALECDVSTWTVRAWLSGEHVPSPVNQRRINVLARDVGLPPPYPQWNTAIRRTRDG